MTRVPPELSFAVRSDVGLLREGNEDAAYAGPNLLAVADGMGGHAAGEVASRVAITALAELDGLPPQPDVLTALGRGLDLAQRALRQAIADDDAREGMGTTLTALLRGPGGLGLLHVGDSRAYLLRDGELRQLTHDHTFVQELVDAGQLTETEAGVHPQRALLTRALDGRSPVEPDMSVHELLPGDRYLLCTDGLSGVVSVQEIQDCLSGADPADAARRLIEAALSAGGPDNVTVVVCDVAAEGDSARAPQAAGAAADLLTEGARPVPTDSHRTEGAESSARRTSGSRPVLRRLVVALGMVGVLAAAAAGAVLWLRSQYFVGVQDDHVTIFRGVAWSLGGISLHTVSEQLEIRPAALPQFERERLQDGISAASLPQARAVAGRLAASCSSPTAISSAADSATDSAADEAADPAADGASPAASGPATPRPSSSPCVPGAR